MTTTPTTVPRLSLSITLGHAESLYLTLADYHLTQELGGANASQPFQHCTGQLFLALNVAHELSHVLQLSLAQPPGAPLPWWPATLLLENTEWQQGYVQLRSTTNHLAMLEWQNQAAYEWTKLQTLLLSDLLAQQTHLYTGMGEHAGSSWNLHDWLQYGPGEMPIWPVAQASNYNAVFGNMPSMNFSTQAEMVPCLHLLTLVQTALEAAGFSMGMATDWRARLNHLLVSPTAGQADYWNWGTLARATLEDSSASFPTITQVLNSVLYDNVSSSELVATYLVYHDGPTMVNLDASFTNTGTTNLLVSTLVAHLDATGSAPLQFRVVDWLLTPGQTANTSINQVWELFARQRLQVKHTFSHADYTYSQQVDFGLVESMATDREYLRLGQLVPGITLADVMMATAHLAQAQWHWVNGEWQLYPLANWSSPATQVHLGIGPGYQITTNNPITKQLSSTPQFGLPTMQRQHFSLETGAGKVVSWPRLLSTAGRKMPLLCAHGGLLLGEDDLPALVNTQHGLSHIGLAQQVVLDGHGRLPQGLDTVSNRLLDCWLVQESNNKAEGYLYHIQTAGARITHADTAWMLISTKTTLRPEGWETSTTYQALDH